ncbi:hypothetical protein [Morganella psychrotolerans]|uniref:hypothetical protein n=1 Tax=Morganella psychrotolerans TaxID=368603 RepID=UPI0012E72B6D|nr:hypothetical protein [Morganella psychrotolerans]
MLPGILHLPPCHKPDDLADRFLRNNYLPGLSKIQKGQPAKKGKRRAPWMARSERTGMCLQRLSALPVIPTPESERRGFCFLALCGFLFFTSTAKNSEGLTGKKRKA